MSRENTEGRKGSAKGDNRKKQSQNSVVKRGENQVSESRPNPLTSSSSPSSPRDKVLRARKAQRSSSGGGGLPVRRSQEEKFPSQSALNRAQERKPIENTGNDAGNSDSSKGENKSQRKGDDSRQKAPQRVASEYSYGGSAAAYDIEADIDQSIFEDDELAELKARRAEKKKQLGVKDKDTDGDKDTDENFSQEDADLLNEGKIKIERDDGTFAIVNLYDEDEDTEKENETSGNNDNDVFTGTVVDDSESSSYGEVENFKEPWEADDDEDDPFTDVIDDFDIDPTADDFDIFEQSTMADPDDELQPGQSVIRGFDINAVLAKAFDDGASDVYVIPYEGIFFNKKGINGIPMREFKVPDARTTREAQLYLTLSTMEQIFIVEKELDASYVIRLEKDTLPEYRDIVKKYEGRRLRVSMSWTAGAVYMVFRTITDTIGTPEDYGVPQEIVRWFYKPHGMILVNGSTGTGKSTTMSSIIRKLQLEKPKIILTAEKPVEYKYPSDGKGRVIQREVGPDTHSFSNALTTYMRQSPDIILIGEVRDREEVSELLRAAETGHLAISTMHTNTVAGTIMRIKGIFSGEERESVLTSLADSLRGIVNQLLLSNPDGSKQFAVREYITVNREIKSMIRNGDAEGIREYQRARKIIMEQQLVSVSFEGRCTVEHAREKSEDEMEFDRFFIEEILSGSSMKDLVFEDEEMRKYYNLLTEKTKSGDEMAVQKILETENISETMKEFSQRSSSKKSDRKSSSGSSELPKL